MTLLDHRGGQPRLADDFLPRSSRTADAATIIAVYVALQFVLPSRLVMNGLPLSLSAASLVALGLGALWFCTQMTTTLGAAKGSNPVRTMLFAYTVTLIASYGSSSFGYLPPDERKMTTHALVLVFTMIFLGLAICDGVRSRDRLYFLLRVIVVCGSVVSLVGILQYLASFDLTPYLRPPGMHFTNTDPTVIGRAGLRRVSGTTDHPIEFGVFCAMLLPLAIHVAFDAAKRGRPGFWRLCLVVIGAGLMFSVSRSAILGVVVVALVLFIGWPARRRVWMLGAGLGFLVMIKFVSPGLLGAFFGLFKNAGSDDSVMWRTHDYATARILISQHLLLGRGIGSWYAPKHEVFDNQYLLTLVDSGVLGLLTFLGIIFAALYAALRVGLLCYRSPERVPTTATDRDLALSLGASILVILPTMATFDFAAFPTVTSLAFLLMGIAGALLRLVSADVAGAPRDPYAVV